MREEGRFRKCEESNSWLWEEDEYRSEKIINVRYSKRTRFYKIKVTGKVHDKDVIYIEW